MIIILCVLLVLGIGGYKLYQTGMSGNGPLAALLYLQSPIALTASQRDDISSIVLCFPALHVADTARSFWSSKDQIPETVDVNGATTGRAYWEAFYDLDVYEEITKYQGDVLLLHGTADQMVPYTYSVKANELYENSRLVIIEGAGHGFGGDDGASSLKTIYYYLQQEIAR